MKKSGRKKAKSFVFSDEEYNSNDGMLTSVWGPVFWFFLHTMSFNYPVNPTHADKIHYRNHILGLRHVLPCGKCRANLKENFKKLPLRMSDMKSRETFSRYIYHLQELVNTMLSFIRQIYPLRTCKFNLSQDNIKAKKFKRDWSYKAC